MPRSRFYCNTFWVSNISNMPTDGGGVTVKNLNPKVPSTKNYTPLPIDICCFSFWLWGEIMYLCVCVCARVQGECYIGLFEVMSVKQRVSNGWKMKMCNIMMRLRVGNFQWLNVFFFHTFTHTHTHEKQKTKTIDAERHVPQIALMWERRPMCGKFNVKVGRYLRCFCNLNQLVILCIIFVFPFACVEFNDGNGVTLEM